MSVETQTLSLTSGLRRTIDSNSDSSAENNIRSGAAVLHLAEFINSSSSQRVYFKAYNNTAPTIGTTAPDMVIPVQAGKTVSMAILNGGYSFGTGLSFATVTVGGTTGTTSPSSTHKVTLVHA